MLIIEQRHNKGIIFHLRSLQTATPLITLIEIEPHLILFFLITYITAHPYNLQVRPFYKLFVLHMRDFMIYGV